MENINITQDQRKNLCNELAKLVFKFKNDENVECIYFAAYNEYDDRTSGKTVKDDYVDFRIVFRMPIINSDLGQQLNQYSLLYKDKKTIQMLGIKIHVKGDDSFFYDDMHGITAGSFQHKRENDLYNSVILYDKNGKYTKLKQITEKAAKRYYIPWVTRKNRIEFEPPLTDTLDNALDIKKMESDTETGKEFIKTNPFQSP